MGHQVYSRLYWELPPGPRFKRSLFVRSFDVQSSTWQGVEEGAGIHRIAARYFRRNRRRALVNSVRLFVVVVVCKDSAHHSVVSCWILQTRDRGISVHLVCASFSLRLRSRIVPRTPSSLGKRLAKVTRATVRQRSSRVPALRAYESAHRESHPIARDPIALDALFEKAARPVAFYRGRCGTSGDQKPIGRLHRHRQVGPGREKIAVLAS
jgi:hypothetical protein